MSCTVGGFFGPCGLVGIPVAIGLADVADAASTVAGINGVELAATFVGEGDGLQAVGRIAIKTVMKITIHFIENIPFPGERSVNKIRENQ